MYQKAFMNNPWHDDWSDEGQLDCYILDLIGNRYLLSLGLKKDGKLQNLFRQHMSDEI